MQTNGARANTRTLGVLAERRAIMNEKTLRAEIMSDLGYIKPLLPHEKADVEAIVELVKKYIKSIDKV